MARQLGQVGSAIAMELNPSNKTVRWWLKRFNADGLSVLMDEVRSECPAMYATEQKAEAEVIATGLTNPQER